MRVSVDIDDVTLEFTAGWAPIYENYFGVEITGPVNGWDVSDFTHFAGSREFFAWWEKIDGWSQIADRWVPGARGALDWISEQPGWSLVFATARGSELGAAAARRLGGRGGVYPQATVHTNLGDKTVVPAAVHVDDAPHVAEQFVAAGRPMILFDRPWNQDVETITIDELASQILDDGTAPQGIVRAADWAEVLLILGLP